MNETKDQSGQTDVEHDLRHLSATLRSVWSCRIPADIRADVERAHVCLEWGAGRRLAGKSGYPWGEDRQRELEAMRDRMTS